MPGEENRLAIDLTVFKLIGMYQMVDPDSPKVCGRNVYASVNVALIVCTTAMTVLSTCGFFSGVRDTFRNNDFDVVLILFYYVCIGVGNYKTTVLVLNAAEVWTLFGVARVSFLGNRYCTGNRRRMADRGASLSRFFAWYLALIVVTLTSYAIIPLVTNHRYAGPTSAPGGGAYRKSNVINLRYPFAADTYNTYYPAFYAMECVLAFYTGYGTFAFDLFALTTMYFVSVQYELLASAFRALERGADTGTVDDCSLLNEEELQEHLLSLISDCQTIYKHLKKFYDISRPIGLIQVLGDASGMICMPYLIVLCIQKNGSVFNTETIKFVFTLGIAGLQSYMYCNLFQLVSDKKEAINFAIYSCDWTRMNIRIKKLILLLMRMNTACDNLKLKVTPSKNIDLPMLANVIRSSYSILSVIINRKN